MSSENPSSPRRLFDPVQLLVDMNLAAKVWFGLFLLQTLAVLLLIGRDFLPRSSVHQGMLAIDCAGIAYWGRPTTFAAATNLHVFYAELATHALLNRHPLDFDLPELVECVFAPEAAAKARELRDREAPEHKAKELHQKAEIATLRFARSTEDRVLVSVLGQLVRSGFFEGQTLRATKATSPGLGRRCVRCPLRFYH